MKNKLIIIAAIASLLFGVLTIFAGGSVILGLFGMREREGDYVPYVVWASFISGILYVFASYGFFKKRLWTKAALINAIFILLAGFVALIVWILKDKPYETAIIFKLLFRILFSVGLFWIARNQLRIKN